MSCLSSNCAIHMFGLKNHAIVPVWCVFAIRGLYELLCKHTKITVAFAKGVKLGISNPWNGTRNQTKIYSTEHTPGK